MLHTLSPHAAGAIQRPPGPDRRMTAIDSKASERARMASLIEAVAAKADRAAFAELFRHFGPRVKAFCLSRGASPSQADEITQEAMIQVWRRAGQFDQRKASAATWIFTIARNKHIDMFRRESRPELTAEDLGMDSCVRPEADEAIADGQLGDELGARIESLAPDQAVVIRMAFYQDKTHQAIAEELDLPLGTVKSRIRLALGKLRAGMSEYAS